MNRQLTVQESRHPLCHGKSAVSDGQLPRWTWPRSRMGNFSTTALDAAFRRR